MTGTRTGDAPGEGPSSPSARRSRSRCWWALGHRDRHVCDCVCALPPDHAGHHACSVQVAERS